MGIFDLYTRPTESESYEDPEDQQSTGADSQHSSDSTSKRAFELPSGYRSPLAANSVNKTFSRSRSSPTMSSSSLSMQMTGITDEDRLLMLAKHPNATDQQVMETLMRQQQIKAAREQREQQLLQLGRQSSGQVRSQSHPLNLQKGSSTTRLQQVTFAPAFPVDADTGEAWVRQPGGRPTAAHDTSFDQVWACDVDPEQPTPKKRPLWTRFWGKVFPFHTTTEVMSNERDDSIVSRHDASLSISVASDKTPKISNVNEDARAKRLRLQTGSLTFRDRCERCHHRLFYTKQGCAILALLCILILAIAATIIGAFMYSGSTKGRLFNDARNDESGDTAGSMIPQPQAHDIFMARPTLSPTMFHGSSELPPFFDITTSDPFTTTSNPTTNITLAPTASPTIPAETQPPIEPATNNPTLLQLVTPTRIPTLRPSMSPTILPSVKPTIVPIVSTVAPTLLNSLESPQLTILGASLVGADSDERFGQTVSLSRDGRVLAVGSPLASSGSTIQAGMVQVFEWKEDDSGSGGSWIDRGLPLLGRSQGDKFGSALALNSDGSVLVASEPTYNGPAGDQSGNVRIFRYTKETTNPIGEYVPFGQELSGVAASDHFGNSLSLSADGRLLAVGAPFHDNGGPRRNISGQVMIFDYSPSDPLVDTWQLRSTIEGTDHLDWFGWSVDLDLNGRVVCAGAPRNIAFGGYVRCHDTSTDQIMGEIIQNDVAPVRYDDNFGQSVKVTPFSNTYRVAIGAPGKNDQVLDSGSVSVYEWNVTGEEWSMLGDAIVEEAPGAGDQLGFAVDIHDDILIVGAPGRGTVDHYLLQDSKWERHSSTLSASDGLLFGYSVEQEANRLAVGSPGTLNNTGMVRVYQ